MLQVLLRRLVILCIAVAALASCAPSRTVTAFQREQLFSLGYGVLEDQLNLFSLDGKAPAQKTRMAMRDGIFFVSNGNAAKVLTLSSYGDLLAMIYNPDRNPPPVSLRQSDSGAIGQGRTAKPYPFSSPGEIAVDSRRTIFLEDRVPDSRRSYDNVMQASLEYVVLRFSRDGEYLDYLGQEGVGGTPFPPLAGLYIDSSDDCVVVCLTGSGWTVFRFDPKGMLLATIAIKRDDLPRPPEEADTIASMDKVLASSEGSALVLKLDYYREIVDVETHTQAGIEFSSSWAWIMDSATGSYVERYELPTFETMMEQKGDQKRVPRAWEMIGSAAGSFFLSAVDDDGSTYYGIFDTRSRTMRRFSLRLEPDETLYATFSLSPDGILSALLGSKYEARFVWWRFDKLLGGLAP